MTDGSGCSKYSSFKTGTGLGSVLEGTMLGGSSLLRCLKWQKGLSQKPISKKGQDIVLKYPVLGNILAAVIFIFTI